MLRARISPPLFYAIAFVLLAWLQIIQAWNIKYDALTIDEMAHIPSGYAAVRYGDLRLNPEHPPLLKALSGVPLLFLDLKFPLESEKWKGLNEQWEIGRMLLTDNDRETVIVFARLGAAFLTLAFALILLFIMRRFFGDLAALSALFFFSFSPTLLAHGHLVTTDVAAAFGFFISLFSFIAFLKSPRMRNALLAGFCLGIALLTKFSTFLLVPFLFALGIFWVFLTRESSPSLFPRLRRFCFQYGLIVILAFVLVGASYSFFLRNYPPEKQIRDTQSLLGFAQAGPIASRVDNALTAFAPTRGLGLFMAGLLLAQNRAVTAPAREDYFWGKSWSEVNHWYFPGAYLIKEPLEFHFFTLLAFFGALPGLYYAARKKHLGALLQEHFPETGIAAFCLVYWIASVLSPLHIGIRHLLPAIVFVQLLVAVGFSRLFVPGKWNFRLLRGLSAFLIFFQIADIALAAPAFLSYGSLLIGGSSQTLRYLADSNLDWGQDIKRLAQYAEENNIPAVHVLYYGFDSPEYYLGKRAIMEKNGPAASPQGYWAVSVSNVLYSRGEFYHRQPFQKIGGSMYLYFFPEEASR